MKSSGLSSNTMCSACSISTSRPSGKVSIILRATSRSRISVSVARTTRVGQAIRGREGHRSSGATGSPRHPAVAHESPRFVGAVYKAAGRVRVGAAKGRVRYDRFEEYDKPRKDIRLPPLDIDGKRALDRRDRRSPARAGLPYAPCEDKLIRQKGRMAWLPERAF